MIRVSFPRNILSSFNYFVSLREWLKNKRLGLFRCLTPFPMVEKPGLFPVWMDTLLLLGLSMMRRGHVFS
jgi:hypothetical protein